jgi:beta-barrel assembly-enhancing protease
MQVIRVRRKTLLLGLAMLTPLQSVLARVELQPCKNNVPPAQQVELGQKAGQQVYKQMPVLPDSSPETQYISQLGQKLVAQAPGYKWPYNFHVANVAEINAFALPGGTVFVNLGTIQAAANEAQLAGVMAHEISHVVLQHSVCNAEKQQREGLIAGIGQIAAGVLLGGAAGQVVGQGIGLGAGLHFLKMSRGAEQQADLMGVGILYDAGYDPRGLPQFFETIQAKYGAGGAQFMSDHPNPGNRTEYVNKEIAGFIPKPNYVTTTPAFTNIHNLVGGMHAYTSKEVASGNWKQQSPNQAVAQGVAEPAAVAQSAPPVNVEAPQSTNMQTFRGRGFSINFPSDWKAYGNLNAAMLAPPNGVSQSGNAGGLVYGVLTDHFQAPKGADLGTALNDLLANIREENPGLTPGPVTDMRVAGFAGKASESNNPNANGGRGEHDWIVAFDQPDGSLRYFVFVAPASEFERWRPTFSKMLQTVVF